MAWAAKVTRNGEAISGRVSALLDDAAQAANVPRSLIVIVQGSWDDGSLSGGTHTGGGAFDLRTWNMTKAQREALQLELRRRGVAAWLRGYGDGTTFDPHLHGIVCDEPGLSPQARQQCTAYANARDGLARNGPDPYPRPKQTGFPKTQPEEEDMNADQDRKLDEIHNWLSKVANPHAATPTNIRIDQGVELLLSRTIATDGLDAAGKPKQIQIDTAVSRLLVLVRRQGATIAALDATIAALAANPGMSAADITQTIRDAVADSVIDVEVTVRDDASNPAPAQPVP